MTRPEKGSIIQVFPFPSNLFKGKVIGTSCNPTYSSMPLPKAAIEVLLRIFHAARTLVTSLRDANPEKA